MKMILFTMKMILFNALAQMLVKLIHAGQNTKKPDYKSEPDC